MASSCSDNKKWQVKMRTLSDSATFLFDNETMSDVTFVFNKDTSDSTSIHAHSWLLSMLSPVFYESFKDNFEVNKEIPVSDASHTALMECLRFIYTSECLLTCENVIEIMVVAKKYSLEFLENDCLEFISHSLTADSACVLLEKPFLVEHSDVKDRVISFIGREFGSILKSKFFLNIKKETLETILKINETGPFNEIEIFTGTMKWAAQQCASNKMVVNCENKRRVLGDLLKLIRFPTMSSYEFAHCISQEKGLLTLNEVQELLLEMTIDGENNMGFPKEPRKQILINFDNLKLKHFEIGYAIGYSERSNSEIRSKFTVNQTVWLTEIHFSYSKSHQYGTVELLDNKKVTIHQKSFVDDDNNNKISLMSEPIILSPYREYTININYEKTCEYQLCGTKNMPWSDVQNGIEFRFSELSRLLLGLSFKTFN